MSDPIIAAYIGFGGIILGAIIAGPITYYYSQKLIRQTHENALEIITQQERIKAALHFKRTVLQSIEGWYNNEYWNPDINIQIIQAVHKIELAVAEYRGNLPDTRRRAFDEQWAGTKDYLQNHVRADEYFKFQQNPVGIDPRVKFKDHVDILLSYAD